jgi:hypothetical protein
MKVHELIALLNSFPPGAEVTISDGYEYRFYSTGRIAVCSPAENEVDIGIGGCLLEDEDE